MGNYMRPRPCQTRTVRRTDPGSLKRRIILKLVRRAVLMKNPVCLVMDPAQGTDGSIPLRSSAESSTNRSRGVRRRSPMRSGLAMAACCRPRPSRDGGFLLKD